jgi:hypothetical protein
MNSNSKISKTVRNNKNKNIHQIYTKDKIKTLTTIEKMEVAIHAAYKDKADEFMDTVSELVKNGSPQNVALVLLSHNEPNVNRIMRVVLDAALKCRHVIWMIEPIIVSMEAFNDEMNALLNKVEGKIFIIMSDDAVRFNKISLNYSKIFAYGCNMLSLTKDELEIYEQEHR